MTPGALILADDLTGAADCGVQAVRRGLRTVVSLQGSGAEADVLAIDLDTRAASEANALARTREAARTDTGLLYVKVDSRLRGHLGAAVDGALDGARASVAIVAPAFPGQRRTTVEGRQCVDGEPVADLVALLRSQSRHEVRGLTTAAIHAGELDALLAEPGDRVVACDAVDDADLERIVAAGRGAARPLVWVGSAGLAAALFEGLPTAAAAPAPAAPAEGSAVLAVVGSVAQLTTLLARPGCVGIPVDPAALVRSPGSVSVAEEARAVLARGEDAIVHLTPGAPRLGREQAARIAAGLAEAIAPAVEDAAGLLLTGGETARAVCDRAGLTAIDLLAEVEPGVPLGLVGTPARPVVTKSGAFGHPETLTVALDAIKEHCRCPTRS